jgi:hypothetical protein
MSKTCEFIDICKFYRMTQGQNSQVWKILLRAYHFEGLIARCSKVAHFRKSGEWPADSLSPMGELPETFFRLR